MNWNSKIKTNLPEVMVDRKDLRDKMKSTLSLKYGIDINDATKFEIQSSYNLRTTEHKNNLHDSYRVSSSLLKNKMFLERELYQNCLAYECIKNRI